MRIDEFIDLMDRALKEYIRHWPEKEAQTDQSYSQLLKLIDTSIMLAPPDIIPFENLEKKNVAERKLPAESE